MGLCWEWGICRGFWSFKKKKSTSRFEKSGGSNCFYPRTLEINLSIYPPIHPLIHLCMHPFIHPPIQRFIHLSMQPKYLLLTMGRIIKCKPVAGRERCSYECGTVRRQNIHFPKGNQNNSKLLLTTGIILVTTPELMALFIICLLEIEQIRQGSTKLPIN